MNEPTARINVIVNDDQQPDCLVKDSSSKTLDESHGTALTDHDADSDDSNDSIVKTTDHRTEETRGVQISTRPPIVINEDCADSPHIPLSHEELHSADSSHPRIALAQHAKMVHAKETHFHASRIRDSISVQKRHKVNDDEFHEENPHLEDYLIPHHSVHIEEVKATEKPCVTKCELSRSIMHIHAIASSDLLEPEKPKRKVHFGTVLVRDYDMILGNHPCCGYGPPVTLDWDYLEYEPLDVNEYEFHHPPRRNIRSMGLNYYKRKELLSNAGYTEVELKQSTKQVSRTKINRTITRQFLPVMKVEDLVESTCRKLKRLVKEDHWKTQKAVFA